MTRPEVLTEEDLLCQAGRGDRRAFERLFEGYAVELRRAITLRWDSALARRLDLSDVIQETHVDVWRRMDEFLRRRPMPFRIWVRKTALERLQKLRQRHIEADRRSVKREAAFSGRTTRHLIERLVQRGPSPSQELFRQERATQIRQALSQLGEVDREILLMRYVEDLTYEEIACVAEFTAEAIRKRHGRALVKMALFLQADEMEEHDA